MLPLAIPEFIYSEPTLAQGGGAEVVSLANADWFTNNGFNPDFSFVPSQSTFNVDCHQQEESISTPFGFELPPDPPPFVSGAPRSTPDFSILQRNVPRPLPVYSATGFDLLNILARVATRSNPRVVLGPVDLTCSFVVVDIRRFDQPIVYCSPSFCTLSGYSEAETIGRNCRFLQAPSGDVRKGERRTHTSHEAVSHIKKCLIDNKECQTQILNYRKDGMSFVNLVTIIPLAGGVSGSADEEDEYVYHVGFQVDLTAQNAVINKLRRGSYLNNYPTSLADISIPSRQQQRLQSTTGKERRANSLPPVVMSKELKRLIANPGFIKSIPLSTSTVVPPSSSSSSSPLANQEDVGNGGANHLLHMYLLEATPDFIHVVCLKGSFLYVAPSVRRVLGYEPEEMLGKFISDYAHPADVVPLMRQLKESSSMGSYTEGGTNTTNLNLNVTSSSSNGVPRTVNLLFRARTKMERYVWVQSRGRWYVEPGKGRKAIVLSGRAKEMSKLSWEDVRLAGGLTTTVRKDKGSGRPDTPRRWVEQEVWGMISGHREETMTFLSVGKGVEDVLGWSADELVGRSVMDIVLDEGARNALGSVVSGMRVCQQRHHGQSVSAVDLSKVKRVQCSLRKKGSGIADVWFIIYSGKPNEGSSRQVSVDQSRDAGLSISPVPFVYQIRLLDAETLLPVLVQDPANPSLLLPLPPTLPPPSTSLSYNPSGTSSSSLAGAVPVLNLSSASSSSTTPASTIASLDMFDELAILRGSSWQYELQQLRFANVRLKEELAALEASSSSSVTVGEEVPSREGMTSHRHDEDRDAGGSTSRVPIAQSQSDLQFPLSSSTSSSTMYVDPRFAVTSTTLESQFHHHLQQQQMSWATQQPPPSSNEGLTHGGRASQHRHHQQQISTIHPSMYQGHQQQSWRNAIENNHVPGGLDHNTSLKRSWDTAK